MKTESVSYFLNSRIDIQTVKESLDFKFFHAENDEIFFIHGQSGFFHLTQYGSLVFLGVSENDRRAIIARIEDIMGVPDHFILEELLHVEIDPEKEYEVEFDHLTLPVLDQQTAQTSMIVMAESAALHFYRQKTDELLEKTRGFTARLSNTGHIGMSRRKLRTFIGNTLNLKGTITENLYLFDTPPIAWKTEFLNQLDKDLNQHMEIYPRYRAISYKLDIVTENLSLFKDLMQHRHSSFLEWIIIILILIEVVNMFIERFL